MYDIDRIDSQEHSVTATVCENARLFGATPEPGELDPREVWDRDHALDAVGEAVRILATGVAPDGFQLADERASPCSGASSTASTPRCEGSTAASTGSRPSSATSRAAQDGSEVKSPRARAPDRPGRRASASAATPSSRCATQPPSTTAPRPAASGARAAAATRARPATSPRPPSTPATSSARGNDRAMRAHLPEGTLVAITGGKDVRDPGAVTAKLDQTRAKHPDMVLVHGGGPGVERIAAQWAERNGVHQVVCRPDWNRHGRAAPFRRNDALLNLLPKGPHRLPRLGDHRQPRREGGAARHPRRTRCPELGIAGRAVAPRRAARTGERRTQGLPAGRVNDGVFINPVREGP